MTSLRERKTRLAFETDAEVRHLGVFRSVIIEPTPYVCVVRLKGTRIRYEMTWLAIFERAAAIAAERLREERAAKRKNKARRK